MPDREKVIKGLEICMDINGNCYDCPYTENGEDPECCGRQAMTDAIALLKRDETTLKLKDAIIKTADKILKSSAYCPNCGAFVEVVGK